MRIYVFTVVSSRARLRIVAVFLWFFDDFWFFFFWENNIIVICWIFRKKRYLFYFFFCDNSCRYHFQFTEFLNGFRRFKVMPGTCINFIGLWLSNLFPNSKINPTFPYNLYKNRKYILHQISLFCLQEYS